MDVVPAQRVSEGRFKEKYQQINIRGASELIPSHPAVPYLHFAPLINICLSASLMTPAIHQQATEAAAPPQRGELDATRLIKTTQTAPTSV